MVKICSAHSYPNQSAEKYEQHFNKYSFPLSNFQKHAIEGIVEGTHVLVTAHTGSGKTLPAEFAIEYFIEKGKKVIYTGPIKALINQKFYDFTKKFPHISFGILTGDIKFNPDAQVLIMTAEILLNKLYQNNSISNAVTSNINFDMDFNNELACVVMDEVHYINEQERGHVWESTIMMLPHHIQMVMLSATIDQPEKFALWIETRGETAGTNHKNVYLTPTTERVVPLTHYCFITTNNGIFKAIKDKQIQEEIKAFINKPHTILTAKGQFQEETYHKVTKMLKLFENNHVIIKRQHVLNQVCKYMVENEMLPALCFVLSRKQLEICANEVTTNLLEFDSKVPYTIDYECEQIIRKLPNYKEYLELPEYINMVALLRKGIAIHHSGVMPVLKEMVELLYAKGYIKLLFATETFSVGINMPTKTVIFTSCHKFDGTHQRMLYGHEYNQCSGRAGRRGIDTVGHVLHLNNLFRNVDSVGYKTMLNGKPQTLVSKFKISYNLLLNLIDIGDKDMIYFARRSMVQDDILDQQKALYTDMQKIELELEKMQLSMSYARTPAQIVNEYIQLCQERPTAVNKKRKDIERRIQNIQDNYKYIETDKQSVAAKNEKVKTLESLKREYQYAEKYLDTNVHVILDVLEKDGYIEKALSEESNETIYKLTPQGLLATSLRETHCLVFAKLVQESRLTNLSVKQLVALFSCFTNVNVKEDYKSFESQSSDDATNAVIKTTAKYYQEYNHREQQLKINTGMDYYIHYDLVTYVEKWCDCETEQECKYLLQIMETEKEIFLGEFVKALLKINNISSELEKLADQSNNLELLSKLTEIPKQTLKYVVTNQSLYV